MEKLINLFNAEIERLSKKNARVKKSAICWSGSNDFFYDFDLDGETFSVLFEKRSGFYDVKIAQDGAFKHQCLAIERQTLKDTVKDGLVYLVDTLI